MPGQIADNGQLAFTPEIVTRRTSVRAGKRDTVATIARKYKVLAADVANWNDVKSGASFKAGEQVVVYLPVRMANALSARAPAKSVKRTAAGSSQPTRKGGTPSKVKKR